jgi:hypothetical protein
LNSDPALPSIEQPVALKAYVIGGMVRDQTAAAFRMPAAMKLLVTPAVLANPKLTLPS